MLTLTPNHPIFSRIPGPPWGGILQLSLVFWGSLGPPRSLQRPHLAGVCLAQFSLCPCKQQDMHMPGSPVSTLEGSQAGPSLACPASGLVLASCVQHLGKASSAHTTKPSQRQLSDSAFLAQSTCEPFGGVYLNVNKCAPTPQPWLSTVTPCCVG